VAITVSLLYFPIVLLDLGGGDRTEADFRAMFEALHQANLRAEREKTRYALVAITSKNTNAAERKLIAAYANKVSRAERRNTLVSVCVISNSFIHGSLTALGWLIPELLPTIVPAASSDAAVEIAESYLSKHGVPHDRGDADLAARWLSARVRDAQVAET
jgi:hypothetical protein